LAPSLFSAEWHRVARVQPRLRAQVRVRRQRWRDQQWYVLSDDANGRQHRINEAAYQFIGRCDGTRTVQEVWDAVLECSGDAAPTQDEVIRLLGQLNEQELLQSERAPDTGRVFQRHEERGRRQRRMRINPFAFRLPLLDPSAWLLRLDPLGKLLFRPVVFWLWLLGVGFAALAAGAESEALWAHARLHMLTPGYVAMTLACYPLIKLLHELGHALAVRRWGGEVHEFGIGLLVLVPAPYVDASAASAFPRRRERAMVGAAGIMVELALAAVALWFWLNLQPGPARDVAFVVLFIGSASTLVFNGNPLLRFDAYYVLCDLLDLPNLASRSNAYWNFLLRRHVLRARADGPALGRGERKWLLAFAPLSAAYRAAISVAIVLWLGGKWVLLGLLVTAYLVVGMVLRPLVKWSRQTLAATEPGREHARVRLGLGVLATSALFLLCVLPLPFSTVAPAVVWLPDEAQVRSEVDGFIAALPVRDGEAVEPGQLLAVLSNPELQVERDKLASRLDGLHADQYRLMLREPSAAENLGRDIERTEAELARAVERVGQLEVRAQASGKLVMPRQSDLVDTYARHGTTLGYVLAGGDLRVRAAVAEEDAYLVRNRSRGVHVRLAEAPGVTLQAALSGAIPAATRRLPSPALADRGGGPYASDPADKDGVQSLEPVFLFDLTLRGRDLERVGGRALVRFDHGFEPLAAQGYRRATQLFLKHFAPRD
jgi:putative peptide zinc metalloprotease protein